MDELQKKKIQKTIQMIVWEEYKGRNVGEDLFNISNRITEFIANNFQKKDKCDNNNKKDVCKKADDVIKIGEVASFEDFLKAVLGDVNGALVNDLDKAQQYIKELQDDIAKLEGRK